MPLYEYKCAKCGFKFEKLIAQNKEALIEPCEACGAEAMKQISSFNSSVPGSMNESDDVRIGREANARWQKIYDNQSKRHQDIKTKYGKNVETVNIPKDPKTGKYVPIMGLGPKKEKETRKEYVTALQDHRKDRKEKGIPQFSTVGDF